MSWFSRLFRRGRKSQQPKKDKGKPKHKASHDSRSARSDSTPSDWKTRATPLSRRFEGPSGVNVPLRVSFTRSAHAEIVAHTKSDLSTEVCGVLIGHVCQDDEGPFLDVQHTIPGTNTRQDSVHVTFTHDTWNEIHRVREAKFPDAHIVGWYHSHPGFGVTFSEMDLFIQSNFFSSPHQVAVVIDPVSGEEGLCVNTPQGIKSIDRFWIEGREYRGAVSAGESTFTPAESSDASLSLMRSMQSLEERLAAMTREVDEERSRTQGMLLTFGMIIAFAIVAWIGTNIYEQLFAKDRKPPELLQFVPVPVRVGDATVMLGVGIVEWKIPPSHDPLRELNELKRELEKKEKSDSLKTSKADSASTSSQPTVKGSQ